MHYIICRTQILFLKCKIIHYVHFLPRMFCYYEYEFLCGILLLFQKKYQYVVQKIYDNTFIFLNEYLALCTVTPTPPQRVL